MSDIDGLGEALRRALDRALDWLGEPEPSAVAPAPAEVAERERMVRVIGRLRSRAGATLVNVGLLGSFSSGKSFLVGGLQERLEYLPGRDERGIDVVQYIGLLHSAPRPTTSCPTSVIPVPGDHRTDASGWGHLRVRFTDSAKWAEIGNSQPPAVVAAYTSLDRRTIVSGRWPAHRERTVAEAEILLADPPLPAKLYDLPGTGAPHPEHDEIATNAWADADCFIYVSQATRTLSKEDLELIKQLYVHHLTSGKRIIWVLTGIDRLTGHDLADTLEANNAYLREHFPPAGPVDTFVGPDGFLPVSPAWEAHGRHLAGRGETDRSRAYVEASRMDLLRRAIGEVIEDGVGRHHLTTLAMEALALVNPRLRAIRDLREATRLPVDQHEAERRELRHQLHRLQTEVPAVRERLTAAMEQHLDRAEESFGDIAGHLHAELDDEIHRADLREEAEVNRIDVHKARLLRDWTVHRGPAATWQAEFAAFAEGTLEAVRTTVRESATLGDLGRTPEPLDLDQLMVAPGRRYRPDGATTLAASDLLELSSPAGASLVSLGAAYGPVAAVSAAVVLAAGLAYARIRHGRSTASELRELRQEWVDGLDTTAGEYRAEFMREARASAQGVLDGAVKLLDQRRDVLHSRLMLVEAQLADPGILEKTDLVERLGTYCAAGDRVVAELSAVVRG